MVSSARKNQRTANDLPDIITETVAEAATKGDSDANLEAGPIYQNISPPKDYDTKVQVEDLLDYCVSKWQEADTFAKEFEVNEIYLYYIFYFKYIFY